jgi:hypothetical protein
MEIKSPRGAKYNFKIGADPEFFVQLNGKVVSAYGLVPGTKDKPYPVTNGAVQVDGMALEFNIDPADSYSEFEVHMSSVLDSIVKMVPGYELFVQSSWVNPDLYKTYGHLPAPVADFGKDYIASQPKEARELGCSPDWNAYTRSHNPRPDAETPFRTASGHVHIGWTEGEDASAADHIDACCALAKSLDVWLGLPSLVWDKDDRRRTLYGAAGAFRPKSYGMEYRVLSNSWILNPLLRQLVYFNTIEAIKTTFANPVFGDTRFGGFTAKGLIEMKDRSTDNVAYHRALGAAFTGHGIRTPSYYRKA